MAKPTRAKSQNGRAVRRNAKGQGRPGSPRGTGSRKQGGRSSARSVDAGKARDQKLASKETAAQRRLAVGLDYGQPGIPWYLQCGYGNNRITGPKD